MPRKEKHWGIVTNADDPEKRGRLCVQASSIVGEDVLDWVEPNFFFVDSAGEAGAFFVPNVGSVVEVEIEAEDDSETTDLSPKWSCALYPSGTVPPEFAEHYPKRYGWKTRAGHVLYCDDTDGDRAFLYRHPEGAEITVDDDGNIRLKPAGQTIYLGDNATEPLARGNILDTFLGQLVSWAGTHSHPSHGAPPSTLPPTVPSDLLSTHKVE